MRRIDLATLDRLHDEAIGEAEQGFMLQRTGDTEAAQVYFQHAADLERQACDLLEEPPAGEPTWSIMHLSLASCLLNAGDYTAARTVAMKMLVTPGATEDGYLRGQAESIVAEADKLKEGDGDETESVEPARE